jgi:hypothetical protein
MDQSNNNVLPSQTVFCGDGSVSLPALAGRIARLTGQKPTEVLHLLTILKNHIESEVQDRG